MLHAGTCTRVVDEYNLKGDYPHHFQVEVRSTVFTLTAGPSGLVGRYTAAGELNGKAKFSNGARDTSIDTIPCTRVCVC